MDKDIQIKEEQRKFVKRNVIFYASVAVLLISLTFKYSYAYITVQLLGNESATPTVINTSDLRLQFLENESNYISADDMLILSSDEVEEKAETATFKIQNVGTIPANYRLSFDITLMKKLISEDFKYQLTVGNQVFSGNFGGITKPEGPLTTTTTASVELTNTDLTLEVGAVANCELKLWLQETNQNQIDLTEGTFSGSIKITAVS